MKRLAKCVPIAAMPIRLACAVLSVVLVAAVAEAQEPDPCDASDPLLFEGTVPDGPETHFFVPFEVTDEDIVEIVVCHDDLSSANILDWGLDDPNGFRGWGGGNSEPAIVGIETWDPRGRGVLEEPRRRIPTRPSKQAERQRIAAKRRHGRLKRKRGRITDD